MQVNRDQLVQAVRSVPVLRGADITLPGRAFAITGPVSLNFAEAEAIVEAVSAAASKNHIQLELTEAELHFVGELVQDSDNLELGGQVDDKIQDAYLAFQARTSHTEEEK